MRVDICQSDAADRLLSDASFVERWEALYHECPWRTVFQSPAFATTWYRCYRQRFEPIIVCAHDGRGDIVGLLFLTREASEGMLRHVGAFHAEYQVWLCSEELGEAFIDAAIDQLRAAFPGETLLFEYLPPQTPMGWSQQGRWSAMVEVLRFERPLMDVKGVEASLRKKSNRSRIKRLERCGPVVFEQIKDARSLELYLDDIGLFYDLRMGAINDVRPFAVDPVKKRFHLEVLGAGRVLHATVLRAGDSLVSAQLNTYNRDEVLLSITAHNPLFAKHSPGKLHMLLLGRHLLQEGIETFDLSPTGDYKDRFASHGDECFEVRVFPDRASCVRVKAQRRVAKELRRAVKSPVAGRLGIDADALKGRITKEAQKWAGQRLVDIPARVVGDLTRVVSSQTELRCYVCDLSAAKGKPEHRFECNHLTALLHYRRANRDEPAEQAFLERALAYLEAGSSMYSRVEQGRLTECAWVSPAGKVVLARVACTVVVPKGAIALQDLFLSADRRTTETYAACLAELARTGAVCASCLYTWVPADHAALQSAVEASGYRYIGSCFRATTLGRARSWQTLESLEVLSHRPSDG